MNLEYDSIGDILYIRLVTPDASQLNSEVAEGVFVRRNATTHRIESTEVQGLVARRRARLLPLEVPLPPGHSVVSVDLDEDSRMLILGAEYLPTGMRQRYDLRTLSLDYEREHPLAARKHGATA